MKRFYLEFGFLFFIQTILEKEAVNAEQQEAYQQLEIYKNLEVRIINIQCGAIMLSYPGYFQEPHSLSRGGALLTLNGATGNIQGNLDRYVNMPQDFIRFQHPV